METGLPASGGSRALVDGFLLVLPVSRCPRISSFRNVSRGLFPDFRKTHSRVRYLRAQTGG